MSRQRRSLSPRRDEFRLAPSSTCPLAPTIQFEQVKAHATPIAAMSFDMQEAFLLEDILYVLLGLSGSYITTLNGEFRLAPGIDSSLRDMTLSILKMARNYVAVNAFINSQSQIEYGTVNHALASSIRELTSEYLVLVAQLEHQFLTNPSFTLHSLSLHARPTAQSLSVIYDLIQDFADVEDEGDDSMEDILEQLKAGTIGTTTAKRKKGAAVLETLTSRLRHLSGDPVARKILSHLLRDASVPYTEMLNMWIHHGLIVDPHEEFMIREQSSIKKEGLKEDYTGVYWDKRYTIRKNDVPSQLEDVKDRILLAGKYLNVVRECSDLVIAAQQDHPKDFDSSEFLDNIQRAYAHANNTLLSLLLAKHEFALHMTSIKYYFFLSNSDFFTGFQHHAAAELSKSSKSINQSKLQSLLDININIPGTIAGNDKFNHHIKIDMARESLFDLLGRINSVTGLNEEAARTGKWTETIPESDNREISGYMALQFDYFVPFPLSLVINRKAIFRYQLLFRHLFSLRYTESQLNEAWVEVSKSRIWLKKSSRSIEQWKGRAWMLRAKMLGFVNQVNYYCTSEVIDPRFNAFIATLHTTGTVDSLMQNHEDFLDTCLKECMLTNQSLLRLYAKILSLCQAFAQFCFKLSKYLEQVDRKHDDAMLQSMSEKLEQYEKAFERTVKVLLDTLNYIASTETVSLLVLSSRLDWNKGFRDDAGDY